MKFEQAWKLMDEEGKIFTFNACTYKSVDGHLCFQDHGFNDGKEWKKTGRPMRGLLLGDWQEKKEPAEINPCPACGAIMDPRKEAYHYLKCRECLVSTGRYSNKAVLIEEWNKATAPTEKKEEVSILIKRCYNMRCIYQPDFPDNWCKRFDGCISFDPYNQQ